MYPRPESTLSLDQIAKEWARDLPQHPHVDEVRTLLVRAFWRGDLTAKFGTRRDVDGDPRRIMIDILLTYEHQHPGLLFASSQSDIPPQITKKPDGSLMADIRTDVIWPRDEAVRSETIVREAMAALAGADWSAYCDDCKVVFLELDVSQEDFRTYCGEQGYPLPAFWFSRKARSAVSPTGAGGRFRKWLRAEVRQHGETPPQDKGAYLLQVQTQAEFRGLSKRSFETIWRTETPKSWRPVGKPPAARRLPKRR